MQLIPNKAETETMRKVTYNGIIFFPPLQTQTPLIKSLWWLMPDTQPSMKLKVIPLLDLLLDLGSEGI